jgi:hypothetical protein
MGKVNHDHIEYLEKGVVPLACYNSEKPVIGEEKQRRIELLASDQSRSLRANSRAWKKCRELSGRGKAGLK